MRRFFYLRIGSRDFHLPKLVGSFALVWAVIMLFHASAVMFDSWDNLKAYVDCEKNIDYTTDEGKLEFSICANNLYNSTGVVVRPSNRQLTIRQFWQGLLVPIANLFFWLAVIFLAWMFYRSDYLTLPVEEVSKFRKESVEKSETIVRPFAKRKVK